VGGVGGGLRGGGGLRHLVFSERDRRRGGDQPGDAEQRERANELGGGSSACRRAPFGASGIV
jgi:hypothetical protein